MLGLLDFSVVPPPSPPSASAAQGAVEVWGPGGTVGYLAVLASFPSGYAILEGPGDARIFWALLKAQNSVASRAWWDIGWPAGLACMFGGIEAKPLPVVGDGSR